MSVAAPHPAAERRLLSRITCPHCWERFSPEAVLWISEHTDLLGDLKLGQGHYQRFLPSRFNVDGNALDAKAFPCHSLACPKCHLGVPRGMLELDPLFVSIVGAPQSGKSVLLAAMIWELRKILGSRFSLSFTDADTLGNQRLNQYEQSLFMNTDPERLIPLGSLIEKTETAGNELYDTVSFGRQTIIYPRPFLFALQPDSKHPNSEKAGKLGRMLTLYDNAGESFQPGEDRVESPVTRHLAQAAALMMIFDPTADTRFREKCRETSQAELFAGHRAISRQEPIIQEVASRVRRYANLRQHEKHKQPLIVVLTKFDSWHELLPVTDYEEPWKVVAGGKPGQEKTTKMAALDVGAIEERSRAAEDLLLEVCPEIVNSARAFCEKVVFIPVTALGWGVALDEGSKQMAIRPRDTNPYWVTVPMLYALSQLVSGLVPTLRRK